MNSSPYFSPYYAFIAVAHALRRHAERGSPAMGATYGVAAHPLPFQLATVNRILTDIRIRHLIADEVGLGKTIQAIMVLNALAARDPDHCAVVVAPERLLYQWHEELWTRGHILGHIVDDNDRARMKAYREYLAEGDDIKELPANEEHPASRYTKARVLLLRPADVIEQSEWLAPSRHHMLIIDEPQSIQREALGRLQQASNPVLTEESTFRQLLVLSATPRLGDLTWRDIILDLIEPERKRLAEDAGQDVLEWLDTRERKALKKLEEQEPKNVATEGALAFRRHARTRRMSRQTRQNWGQYFPTRRNEIRRFSPLASECGRLELIDYLLDAKARSSSTTLDGNPWPTVRSLLRSRRSAREAIDRLERPPEFVARIRNDALLDFGDSRLDALTDLLSEIFDYEREQESEGARPSKREKIVIVAGDAGTIDMLTTVLPRYFPELAEGGIAALKRTSSTSESTFEDMRVMHEVITPFAEGDARILLIGDWIQAGLNLQHSARNMIFYSLPWDPQAVDQLIGRIDRLSHSSIVAAQSDRAKSGEIRIWQLVMRHSPEERLLDAMDALGVFDRPLPQLSEETWGTINRLIVEIVINSGVRADMAMMQLREMGDTWRNRGFASLLDAFEPLTVRPILSETKSIGDIAAKFALRDEEATSPASKIERANFDWMQAIKNMGGYNIGFGFKDHSASRIRYNTIWYSGPKTVPPFYMPDMGQRDYSTDSKYFALKRRDLGAPPARTVFTSEKQEIPYPLQFFDHGSILHDQLCDCLLRFGASHFPNNPAQEIIVRVGKEHPALAFNTCPILISVVARQPFGSSETDMTVEYSKALGEFPKSAAQSYLALYREGLEADRRWLFRLMPTQIAFRGSVKVGNNWEILDGQTVAVLLRCTAFRTDGVQIRSKAHPLRSNVANQCSAHRKSILGEFDQHRKVSLGRISAEWPARMILTKGEAEDAARIYENRAESRARVVSTTEMAAARLGQVEADRRRAALIRLGVESRQNITAQTIRSVLEPPPLLELHAYLRFFPYEQ